MKVLLLTQVLPYPPDSGPKVKTWNLIKWLAAAGHDVTLASFVRGESAAELAPLQRLCRAVHTAPIRRGALRDAWYLLASLVRRQPFLIRRDHRPAMRRLLRRLVAETSFDVVHIDQLNMAQYADCAPGARRVLDAHNALWQLYRRLAQTLPPGPRRRLFEREWRLLRAYEGAVGRDVDAVLAVSDEDRAALQDVIGDGAPIRVMPIAVDCEELAVVRRRPDAARLLHIGTMFWPPNVDAVRWFAEAVYPRIRAERPDAGFDIVGARPPAEIRALAQAGSGIRVTDYVADPTPYLEQAAAMVVPVRAGSGMRVKILNALAQGVPVVTTAVGCEGIAVRSGVHLLIADTPQEFAAAALRLLADRALADELARNGRQLIETRYDYRQVYAPLDDVYKRAVDRAAPAQRLRA